MKKYRFKITRKWEVKAKNTAEAIKKSKNWKHYLVDVKKLK